LLKKILEENKELEMIVTMDKTDKMDIKIKI